VTGWLLDTNILSELRRPKPVRKVVAFVSAQPLDLLYISFVTLAGIRFGIELAAEATHRAGTTELSLRTTFSTLRSGMQRKYTI
jgi:predicted nucleic acid-binding protein